MGSGLGLAGGGGGGGGGGHKKTILIIIAVVIPAFVILGLGYAYGSWRKKHPSKRTIKSKVVIEEAQKIAEEGGELSWEQKKALEKEPNRTGRANVLGYWLV